MPKSPTAQTLFDRLRRAAGLRIALVVAMVLTSQDSLACAFEDPATEQGTEIPANEIVGASAEGAGEDCCPLCSDCAQCGGCHGFAVSLRVNNAHQTFRRVTYAKFSFPTAAPKLWTPPALLRPPISAA